MGNRLSLILVFVGCVLSCASNTKVAKPVQNRGLDVRVSETTPDAQLTAKNLARRDEVEAMMLRGEYLHDGSSVLSGVGDIDSVPALLVVLKKHPPDKNGVMVCTTDHALSALRELTGADPGYTYDAWAAWWKKYKKSHPVSGRLEKVVDVAPS